MEFLRRSGARGAICIHMMETDPEGQKKQWSNPRILELLEERRKMFCELLDLSVERLKEFGSTIEDPSIYGLYAEFRIKPPTLLARMFGGKSFDEDQRELENSAFAIVVLAAQELALSQAAKQEKLAAYESLERKAENANSQADVSRAIRPTEGWRFRTQGEDIQKPMGETSKKIRDI